MIICTVSLNQVWEDKDANIILCRKYAELASKQNCDLLIFPEMTLTGFSMNVEKIGEQNNNSNSIRFFSKLSKEYNLNIIAGVVFFEENDLGSNNLILFSSKGEIIFDYKKMHPFSYAEEDKHYISGNTLGTSKFLNTTFGFTICYDLRFPELYQALSKDSTIIINIANWPAKRLHHWDALLKARAIENQIFMIGVNRIGIDGKNVEYKQSTTVYNPDGGKVIPTNIIEEMETFEINIDEVENMRASFPVKRDRRTEMYKKLL